MMRAVPRRRPSGRFWPTPCQERLLVAALAPPERAAAAWRDLPAGFSLDRLEPGSFELLPLVYRNLAAVGSDDPRLPRLKGIYRRAWVKNNLLLERTRDVAEALRTAAIPALALEGATFAARHYPELGLRPTSTIHVLVRAADEERALSRLAHGCWEPRAGATFPRWHFLYDGGGNICIVRSRLAFDFVADGPASADELWRCAEEQQIAGKAVCVPCATDALLSAVVAGARVGPVPRTQWIADAAMVLRSGAVDWQRLVELAISHGQTQRLRSAFLYLRELPVPQPPADVMETLAEAEVTPRERLSFALASGSIPPLRGLQSLLADHLASTRDEPLSQALASLPPRLRERWGVARSRRLPLAAAGRALGRRGAR